MKVNLRPVEHTQFQEWIHSITISLYIYKSRPSFTKYTDGMKTFLIKLVILENNKFYKCLDQHFFPWRIKYGKSIPHEKSLSGSTMEVFSPQKKIRHAWMILLRLRTTIYF